MGINNRDDSIEKKKIVRQIENKRIQFAKDAQLCEIEPTTNTKFENKNDVGRKPVLHYTSNIRVLLSSFYCGTGGFNVGLLFNIFGIEGGESWERKFHQIYFEVHSVILGVIFNSGGIYGKRDRIDNQT